MCFKRERVYCRMFDPRVDLVTAKWSALDEVTWLMPLLTELSGWRDRLDEIQDVIYTSVNDTDVVFVADFPGTPLSDTDTESIEYTCSQQLNECTQSTEEKKLTTHGVQ